MGDGVDRDFIFRVLIDYGIRKAVAQATTRAMRIAWPRGRVGDDAPDSPLNLVQKVLAESEFAFVVKVARRIELALRFGVKRETHFL